MAGWSAVIGVNWLWGASSARTKAAGAPLILVQLRTEVPQRRNRLLFNRFQGDPESARHCSLPACCYGAEFLLFPQIRWLILMLLLRLFEVMLLARARFSRRKLFWQRSDLEEAAEKADGDRGIRRNCELV